MLCGRRPKSTSTGNCTGRYVATQSREAQAGNGGVGGGGLSTFQFFAWEPLVQAPLLTEIETKALLC